MAAVGRIDAEIGHHQGLQPISNASKKAVDEMVAINQPDEQFNKGRYSNRRLSGGGQGLLQCGAEWSVMLWKVVSPGAIRG